jgi:heme-degrading monooxygenase HmoA
MLLKWIVCQVPAETCASFSSAQRQWTPLNRLPGFLGQIGGWDCASSQQAGILSLWQNEASYRHFMQYNHDEIVEHNSQRETYTSLSVALFGDLFPLPGSQPDFLAALASGTVLRVTVSYLFSEQDQTFIHNQTTIWNPGMAQAQGMYVGVFAQAMDHSSRYLVASLWSDLQAHQAYRETLFPLLREQANLPQTLQSIHGWVLQLEKTWQVLV